MMAAVTNGILIAVVAHGLIGVSLIWDKILLLRPATRSLANYVFWLGSLSVLGLLLIPFGFHRPSAHMAGLALAAGMLHLSAIWFYYDALKRGEASEALTVMGGFEPLATALLAVPLLGTFVGGHSLPAFALLVAGGFVMFVSEKLNWRKILPSVILSASLFGLTNVLQKTVFNATGFISGYVFFTIGTFLGSLLLLVRPKWRREIIQKTEEASPKSRFWYFVNRFISGVGSFLIFFAISRTNPAIVSALAGVRYSIVFAGALLISRRRPDWLCEDFHGPVLIGKSVATAVIVAGLVVLGLHGGTSATASQARVYFASQGFKPSPMCRRRL